MGLIKTAMMSGAAIYGVNQIAKTVQVRNSNPPPRREYSDRDRDAYRPQPLEFRDRDPRDQRYVDTRDMQGYEPSYEGQQRQRLYLQDQRPSDRQPYYMQNTYDERPQYEYASNARSQSTPPLYYSGQGQQQGFVEPTEVVDEYPREANGGSGSRGDMVNMLAEQAMNMGLVGGKKGKKNQGSKGDLLAGLMGK